jgi:putative Mn2+ efflux pump MntP
MKSLGKYLSLALMHFSSIALALGVCYILMDLRGMSLGAVLIAQFVHLLTFAVLILIILGNLDMKKAFYENKEKHDSFDGIYKIDIL